MLKAAEYKKESLGIMIQSDQSVVSHDSCCLLDIMKHAVYKESCSTTQVKSKTLKRRKGTPGEWEDRVSWNQGKKSVLALWKRLPVLDVTRQRYVLLSKWKISWEHLWSQVENAARSDIQLYDLFVLFKNQSATKTTSVHVLTSGVQIKTEHFLTDWQNRNQSNSHRDTRAT